MTMKGIMTQMRAISAVAELLVPILENKMSSGENRFLSGRSVSFRRHWGKLELGSMSGLVLGLR